MFLGGGEGYVCRFCGVVDFDVVLFMSGVGCGCMFYCVLISDVTFINSVVLSIVVIYYARSVLLVLLFGLFICLPLGWVCLGCL